MFKKVKKEELRVPASLDHLLDLRKFIEKVGKRHRLSDKMVNAFKLAVDEASTNIIRHAYRDKSGEILVRAIVRKTSVTISLIDTGRFFDPGSVKDPDLKRYVAIGKRGGLGIFMIRKLVDNLEYFRTEEGNELRLTKKLEKRQRRKLTLPRIPGSLRVKYYGYSMAILTIAVLVVFFNYYFKRSQEILKQTFTQGEAAVRVLAKNSANWIGTMSELNLNKEAKVILSQNPEILAYAVVVDSMGVIKGASDLNTFKLYTKYTGVVIEKTLGSNKELVRLPNGEEEYLISQKIDVAVPNHPEKRIVMGRAYVFIPKSRVDEWIYRQRMKDFRFMLLVLLVGNAGIAFLITLIISPFRRLAYWIRMSSTGAIEDEMDIDTSDEIGEIAQAFNEITYKFRKSQQSLQDQERLKHEMHLAQEIQQTLLPAEFPKIRGFDISSYYESAKEVGGDYYDFVEIDKDRIGVVIADVSGKGVPGSLVMTMIRTALRTEAKNAESAADTLRRVNRFVMGDIKKGMFVTVFYAILNSRTRSLNFASAGHNPMILYRPSTKKTYYLNPKGFPVGISLNDEKLFDNSITDDSIRLSKGDIVVIYTDGVTEAMNSRRELFGEERLLQVIRNYGHLPADEFVAKLKAEITSFTEGQVQNDDISLVVIKEKMSKEEEYEERAREAYYKISQGASVTQACKEVNLPYEVFRKFRKQFDEVGVENFKVEYEATSVEMKHFSIEEQTKIFDIIKKHPEYGPNRISALLKTEEYGFTDISENRIYNELLRLKLNTKQLRKNFIARGTHRRKIKPPGTPLLTLDGRVIIEEPEEKLSAPILAEPEPQPFAAKETHEKEPEKPSAGVEEILSQKDKEKPTKPPKKKRLKSREKKTPLEEDIGQTVFSDIVDLLGKEKEEEQIEEETDELLDLEDVEIQERGSNETNVSNLIGEEETQVAGDPLAESEESGESGSEIEEEASEGEGEISLKNLFESLSGKTDSESDQEGEEEFDMIEYTLLEEDNLLEPDVSQKVEASGEEEKLQEKGPAPAEADAELVKEERVEEIHAPEEKKAPDQAISAEAVFEQLSVSVEDELNGEKVETEETSVDDDLVDTILTDEDVQEFQLDQEEEPETPPDKEKSSAETKPVESETKKIKSLLIAGLRFYLDKKYDKAAALLEKLIQEHPDHLEAHYNLGNVYFRMRDYDKAEAEYLKVIEIDPSFTDGHENLGVIYATRRDYTKAIDIWKKILALHPDREDVRRNIEKALKLSKKQNTKKSSSIST